MRGRTSVTTMWVSVILALALVSGFGCAKKQTAAEPAPAPVAKQEAPQNKEDLLRRDRELAEKRAAAAKEISENKVFFDFDKFDLKPEARNVLTRKAELLKAHPEINVVIEGNCDERGTGEYNLALGEKRAKASYDFLVLMGVSADRMKTVSYGKERQICTEHNEGCWSKNRRDEFKTVY